MGLARAVGHPNYSADGTSKFIPEIWSGKLLVKFYDATVLPQISNTDYEGEIKNQGDKVYIRTRGNVTIKKYYKGMKIEYERIESPSLELVIDQGNYWYYGIDSVDKYQSDIELMDQWAEDATEQEKIVIDTEVLAVVKAQVAAANKGATAGRISAAYNMGVAGTPVELTEANIIKYILYAGGILDEQNMPETGRFFIIPSIAAVLLKSSDIKDASMMGDGKSTLRNGRIGTLDRFTLFSSNLLPKATDGGTCYDMIFGHPLGMTFASQFTDLDYIDHPETTFGKFVKGLHIYGHKVIKPEALGVLYAKPILL
jgi:hypothetical protein